MQKNSPVHPDVVFNETVVTKVDEHKHLGLTLKSNLSFDRHLNEKMTKAKKDHWYSETPLTILTPKVSLSNV